MMKVWESILSARKSDCLFFQNLIQTWFKLEGICVSCLVLMIDFQPRNNQIKICFFEIINKEIQNLAVSGILLNKKIPSYYHKEI